MKKWLCINKYFLTCCGIGFTPFAPGTLGSLMGVFLYFMMYKLSISNGMVDGMLFLLFVTSIPAISRYIAVVGVADPKEVVLDEVFGQILALDIISHYNDSLLRTSCLWWIIAFVVFRLFDILKPLPICLVDQKMKNAWGVMLDDALAGVAAALTVIVLDTSIN